MQPDLEQGQWEVRGDGPVTTMSFAVLAHVTYLRQRNPICPRWKLHGGNPHFPPKECYPKECCAEQCCTQAVGRTVVQMGGSEVQRGAGYLDDSAEDMSIISASTGVD